MDEGKLLTRMYFPGQLQVGYKCVLPPPQAHHAMRVLRLRVGDSVILFNGDGAEYAAVVIEASRDRFALDVTGRAAMDRESPLAVTLAQAVSSGERMDYTVQKAVELGVAAIQPLAARRSVVRLDARARGESAWRTGRRWRSRRASNAAATACRAVLPLMALDACLAGCGARQDGALRVLLSPRAARGCAISTGRRAPSCCSRGRRAAFRRRKKRAARAGGLPAGAPGPARAAHRDRRGRGARCDAGAVGGLLKAIRR